MNRWISNAAERYGWKLMALPVAMALVAIVVMWVAVDQERPGLTAAGVAICIITWLAQFYIMKLVIASRQARD